MQIIFDKKLIPKLKDRYIILELDTVFHEGMKEPLTLYAVVEYPTMEHLYRLQSVIDQHVEMVDQYKNNKFDNAIFNAYALKGSWNGELDEFYDSVIEYSKQLQNSKTLWNGVKYTTPTN